MSECRGCIPYWNRPPPSSAASLCPAHRGGFCVICLDRYNGTLPDDYEAPFPNRRCEHHMDPEPTKVKRVKIHKLQRPVKTANQKAQDEKRRSIKKRSNMSLDCRKITNYLRPKSM